MTPMNITRRSALKSTAVLAAGAALSRIPNLRGADTAGRKLRVAVVALGRGLGHVQALLTLPDVEKMAEITLEAGKGKSQPLTQWIGLRG